MAIARDSQLPAGAAGRASDGDAELMASARAGDRGAFGRLAMGCQDRLFNAILRLVGDPEEAREITQETFARGLANIGSFRGEAQPYTWLFKIAANLAISRLRKQSRRRTFSLDAAIPASASNGRSGHAATQAAALSDRVAAGRGQKPPADPATVAEHRERDQHVLAALGRLDAEYRSLLVMRDIEGFDYQQMASMLDIPLGTLKSRLFRARLALRTELKGYFSA